MRVALDARKAYDGGIGRYIRSLSAAMLELDPGLELVLLLPPAMPGWLGDHPRVSRVDHASRLYGVGELWKTGRVLRGLDVDLVHEPHYTLPFGLPCPTVVTIHDLIHWHFPEYLPNPAARRYARWMIRSAARRADRVITVSEVSRRDLTELAGADPDRVRAIPLGVDPAFAGAGPEEVAEARRELGIDGGYILYVGALKPHKNPDVLVRAFRDASIPDATLLLVGGTPSASLLEAAGTEMIDTGRIRFVATLTDAHLVGLYAGARVVVLPSRYEGFGLPVLEAMAAGAPAVVSRAGSIPEVGGDAVVYVPPGEAGPLADALASLWSDRDRRSDLAARGRERARGFTWAETARRTREVYEAAASGTSS